MSKVEAKLMYNIEQRYYMMYALHDVSMANSMKEHVKINQNMIGTANGVSNQSLKRKKRSYLKHATRMIDDYSRTYDSTLDHYNKKPSHFGYYQLVPLYSNYTWLTVKYLIALPIKHTTKNSAFTLSKAIKKDSSLNPIFKDFTLSFLKDQDDIFVSSQYNTNKVYNVLLLAKDKKISN